MASPTRDDTMYLATLGPEARRKKPMDLSHVRNPLDVSDITGSKHRSVHHQRQDFHGVDDIVGASPKKRMLPYRRDPLNVSDIDGARPVDKSFKTGRVVNPLVPRYEMPPVEPAAPPEDKFLRDAMAVDDIEGAKPRKERVWSTRHKDYSDVTASRKRQIVRPPKEPIAAPQSQALSQRRTDPLAPDYDWEMVPSPEVGAVKRYKPRERLEGPVSTYVHFMDRHSESERRSYVQGEARVPSTLIAGDIPGAQPQVYKLKSKRQTNPLDPQYVPLKPRASVEAPVLGETVIPPPPLPVQQPEGAPVVAPEEAPAARQHHSQQFALAPEPLPFVEPGPDDEPKRFNKKKTILMATESDLDPEAKAMATISVMRTTVEKPKKKTKRMPRTEAAAETVFRSADEKIRHQRAKKSLDESIRMVSELPPVSLNYS